MRKRTSLILLVEDEQAHAELIRRAFESQAGPASLTIVNSLLEARASLAETTPDLAIIDFLLPDGKGIELLPEDDTETHFPIVIMTSHGDEQLAQ